MVGCHPVIRESQAGSSQMRIPPHLAQTQQETLGKDSQRGMIALIRLHSASTNDRTEGTLVAFRDLFSLAFISHSAATSHNCWHPIIFQYSVINEYVQVLMLFYPDKNGWDENTTRTFMLGNKIKMLKTSTLTEGLFYSPSMLFLHKPVQSGTVWLTSH